MHIKRFANQIGCCSVISGFSLGIKHRSCFFQIRSSLQERFISRVTVSVCSVVGRAVNSFYGRPVSCPRIRRIFTEVVIPKTMFIHISVAFIFKSVGNSDFSTHCLPSRFKCIGNAGKPIDNFAGKFLTVNPVVNLVHESFVSYCCGSCLVFGKSYAVVIIIVIISKVCRSIITGSRTFLFILSACHDKSLQSFVCFEVIRT